MNQRFSLSSGNGGGSGGRGATGAGGRDAAGTGGPGATPAPGRRRPERADAARNRQAILRAAEELLRDHPPADVSVEEVAAAAGVGKATVFHRFGTRAGLMVAVMLERAEALRLAATEGPPPLGPGAAPGERLAAFTDALVELATRNAGLLTAHEHAMATARHQDPERQANPVYLFWHGHVASLLAEADPGLDADVLAHMLLGTLHAEPVARLLRTGESARVAAVMRDLAAAVTGG
jgi:AcrR family transcriptional regulator